MHDPPLPSPPPATDSIQLGLSAGISSFCHIIHTLKVENRVSSMELPPTLAPFLFFFYTCEKCGSLHLASKRMVRIYKSDS